mgnify:CR=1 FL=1
MSKFIYGDEKIDKALRDFPKNIKISAIRAAAREGGNIVKDRAKSKVGRIAKNKEGQSKAAYVQRNIRTVASRSKDNPGVNVYIKGKSIPVGKRHWSVQGYGVLLGEGSEKERFTRGTGASRGKFRGYGNFIEKANNEVGSRARRRFYKSLTNHVDKALDRAIK